MKNKKNILIIVFVLIILLSIIGVSYAMYRYSRNGSINNKQIVGDIYMHYNEEELGIDSNGESELTSLYSLNATEENINACVTYLYNTYGESWNGLTYELDESCTSGGATPKKYIPNNTLAKFMSNSGVCSHTYEEYCSNNYSSSSNSGVRGVSVSYKNSFSTTARFMDNDSSDSPYYNAIINDYLNGVMTTADKTYFKNNNIIVDGTTTIPYFEFTIDGKNTYNKKDIWYDINLEYGSNHATRTERIRDEFLKFTLLEIENGNIDVLFQNRSYDSLNNKRIWVDTISSSDGVVNRTYRLYMSFINNIHIGTLDTSDYDINTWNNQVYGSVKVKVTGDFTEKTIDYTETNTPESCFETDVLTLYTRNPNMTTNELNTCVTYIANNIVPDSYIVNPSMNQTELDACVNYFNNTLNFTWDTGEDATSFCNGTGTNWGATFQENLDDAYFSYEVLNDMLSQNIIILKDKTETATNFCNGTEKINNKTFQENADDSNDGFTSEQLTYLLSENIILSTTYNAITHYNSSCGRDVVIPSSIGGNTVDAINLAFSGSSLTSVKFPNTLKYIEKGVFKNNNLLTVNIPSSVESNICDVFDYNVVINTNQNLVCSIDYSNSTSLGDVK